MSTMPAMPPSTGEIESQAPKLYAAAISTFTLAAISMVLRIICRKAAKAPLWWDDWCALLAALPCTATFIVLVVISQGAAGRHIYDVEPAKLGEYLKGFYGAQLTFTPAVTLTKFSILFFYYRLFSITARKPIIIMMVLVALYGICFLFVLAFQCNPVPQAWLHTDPNACMDVKHLFIGGTTPNIVADVILLFMPLPYLYRLHMSVSKRLLLAGVFLVGGFVSVVSIIRLTVLTSQDLNNPDITYYMTDVVMWTMVEENIGLTCCNLPSLRPVLTFLRTGSFFASSEQSQSAYGGKTPASRSKNTRGSQRLFSTGKSGFRGTKQDDEQSFVRITEEEREMSRDIGLNSQVWGKSQAGVEVIMDDLESKEGSSNDGINVKKDWSIRYDHPGNQDRTT